MVCETVFQQGLGPLIHWRHRDSRSIQITPVTLPSLLLLQGERSPIGMKTRRWLWTPRLGSATALITIDSRTGLVTLTTERGGDSQRGQQCRHPPLIGMHASDGSRGCLDNF